jgi:glycosyltransferase involved in cell wall biosynthesis
MPYVGCAMKTEKNLMDSRSQTPLPAQRGIEGNVGGSGATIVPGLTQGSRGTTVVKTNDDLAPPSESLSNSVSKARPIVLHVLEAVGGGTLHHVVDVVRTVETVEHHVALPTDRSATGTQSLNSIAEHELVEAGAVIHRVDMVRNPLHPKIAFGLFKLRRLVSQLRPSAIHGHSSVGGAFARVATIGVSVPVIYTPNGVATSRAILLVERMLAPLTDQFIAVSESEGARALSLGLTSEERMVVIRNGIDLKPSEGQLFDLRSHLELPGGVPLVGTVARLVAQKAPKDFVRVCAEVRRCRKDVHFVLIGTGALQSELDGAVRNAGIADCFHQIPYLPRASDAIEQLDVFVLTSVFEGGAYAPLEAMKAEVPVVLTDVAGNSDTIENEKSGLLYPFGDTSAMAGGVLQLLSDPQLRESIVEEAGRRVRDRFDAEDMGASLEGIYQELILQSA